MANPLKPFFSHMPRQSLGAHWHLAGYLKRGDTGLRPLDQSQIPLGKGKLILLRRIDALSPQISLAKKKQYVIPKLTVTTPSGQKVNFKNSQVRSQTATNEMEEIQITFQRIEYTCTDGGISASDDWQTGSGGSGHKK
jgi:hypothetical protein